MDDIEAKMSRARSSVSSAKMGLRQTERDLARFEQLDKAYRYLREHGGDITVTVRFGASAVGNHDIAAEVTRDFLLGDWTDVRRQLIEDIQREMVEIGERL